MKETLIEGLNHFYNNKTEMELLMKESRKFQLESGSC
jgi:hypothetical protein